MGGSFNSTRSPTRALVGVGRYASSGGHIYKGCGQSELNPFGILWLQDLSASIDCPVAHTSGVQGTDSEFKSTLLLPSLSPYAVATGRVFDGLGSRQASGSREPCGTRRAAGNEAP